MKDNFFNNYDRKPKTKRAKRFLENRAPKLTENTKNAMFIKGGNANSTVTDALKDIVSMFGTNCDTQVTELHRNETWKTI